MLFVFCSNCQYSYSRGLQCLNSWQGCLESLKLLVKVCKDHSSESDSLSVIQQKINFRNINYKREDDFLLSAVILQTIFFSKPLRKENPTPMSRWLEERKWHNFSPNRIGTIQKFDRYIYYLLSLLHPSPPFFPFSLSLSAKLTKFNQKRVLHSRPFTTRTTMFNDPTDQLSQTTED